MAHEAIDRSVAALAARQHGVVTRAQARSLGLSARMIEWRTEAGRWTRVHPGVFVIAGHGRDPHAALLASCLSLGDAAVASHRSAAWLWRLSGFDDPPPPEVLVPRGAWRRRDGVTVHHTDRLDRSDVTRIGVIPVTRIERTLIDLGAVVPEEAVEKARDDVIRRKLLRPSREGWRLTELGGRGRSGSGVLRTIRLREEGLVVPDSELERDVLSALRRRRIPAPTRQHPVVLPSGRTIHLDLSWPDHHVVLEVMGYGFHSGRRPWVADILRSNEATSVRWHILQAAKEHLRDDCRGLAVEIRRLLGLPTISSR